MFGYDLPRLHAALNDLPAALLVVAVFFELVSLVTKREGFRQAGFWTLLVGAVGGAAAVLSGLQAEDAIDHGQAIHDLMETHELYGFITLGVFGVVALWRIVRERRMAWKERTVALLVSLVGVYFLFLTGAYGGRLVFDHAAGIPTSTLSREIENRAGGHAHAPGTPAHDHGPAAASDSTGADSAGGHAHAPGTPPHDHGTPGDTATPNPASPSDGGHTHAPGTPPHEH
ncbi:MAG TPA: DUF2231 domain-containing protein [Gemmatimonadales bacterium]|nr:DUF2231 domain-containing protein [Gemmatimonadales bacterium]